MLVEIFILSIILLLNLYILFGLVRTKEERDRKKRMIFATTIFCVIFWVLSILFTDLFYKDTNISAWLSRFSFFFSSLIALSFFFFSLEFFQKEKKISTLYIYLFTAISLFFSFLTLTDKIVDWVYIEKNLLKTNFGHFYIIFAIYLVLSFLISSFLLLISYKKQNRSREKVQTLLILTGSLISIGTSLITNILLPILKVGEIRSLGPLTLVFFLGFTYYSIIQYRFLSIRIIIGRSLYFLLLAIIPYIVFYVTFILQEYIWGGIFTAGALITGWFIALGFIYFLFIANTKITRFINKNIINKGYDPQIILDALVDKLSIELRLENVIKIIKEEMDKSLKPKIGGVIIFNSDMKNYKESRIIDFYDFESIKFSNKFSGFLVLLDYWKLNGIITIVRDELTQKLEYLNIEKRKVLEELINLMNENKISVVLPLNSKVVVRGAIFIGDKEDESPFTVQDIKFLETLVSYAGVAISRAQLFEEVESYRKELEKKVEKATLELKQKINQLEDSHQREQDMLDILGHELRTPLSIVKNSVGLLQYKRKTKTLTDEKFDEYIEKANESLERELKLIETLLGATKLDARKLELNMVKSDMVDVIEDGIEANKIKASEKGLDIKFTKPEEKIWGFADRTRIQEVFDNLLTNAVKYTEKGYIELKISKSKEDGIPMVKISVKDTGRGISEDDQKNLGQKFYRAHQYSSNKESTLRLVRPGGTGLGLYVTFGLVKAMGGKIEVKSELGKGSEFTFFVPEYTGQIEASSQQGPKDMFKRMGYK